MSESQQTSKHPKPSSDRRNGGGSRHNSETDSQSSSVATPTAGRGKPESGTPLRPGSSLATRVANSTPRLRSRPAPVCSLFTPLGRSLSMHVSKKEKRLSMRLDDPKRLATSTYKDDYQSPEALSLHSLNLETTTEPLGSDPDLTSLTTYRESYKPWRSRQSGDRGLLKSKSDNKDTTTSTGSNSKPTVVSDHSLEGYPARSNTPMSSTRTTSRNGQASEPNSHSGQPSADRPAIQSPTSRHSASFFRRNASSGVIQSSQEGQSLSIDRKPCASVSKDRVPAKPANEKGLPITKPANEKDMPITKPANEKGMPITKPANEKGMPITKPANEKDMPITKPSSEKGMPITKPSSEKGMPVTKPSSEKGMSITKPSSEKDMPITKPANEKGMPITKPSSEKGMPITKPANGNPTPVNGEGLKNPRTPQIPKPTNGIRGRNVTPSESEDRTPRRNRAYQLQSSNGGSPFAYGSDSGSQV